MSNEQIMNEAKKLDCKVSDLKEAYEILKEHKYKDENVYIEFNKHKLYSLLDDLDSCYVKVTGYTKKVFDEMLQEELKNLYEQDIDNAIKEKEQERNQLLDNSGSAQQVKLITDKIDLLNKSKGLNKDIVSGFFWASHITKINNELDVLIANQALDIINVIKDGNFEQGNAMLNLQDHSGCTYTIIRNILKKYATKGKDFVNYLENETENS